ncbi:MAG: TonB-dependent receptor plug domain-containing protein [Balneolaceae bacterium]
MATHPLSRLPATLLLLLSTIFMFVSPPQAALAQAESDTLTIILEPVHVEAAHSSTTLDRATMSVTTLHRTLSDRVSRKAATMDELTFMLPGIWVSNRENHALGERMTIRGMGWRSQFGLRGIQVILDDIPLTVADGQTVLNMVDPATVQSLELLRGPSATFWGNSSGGVLYMKTRPAPDSPALMLRSYYGSFNTWKQEAHWHNRIGGIRWNGYGSYYQTDGYRDHSDANLIRGGLSAGIDISDYSTLDFRVAYSGMPDARHPGSLSKLDAESNPRMAWPGHVNTRSGKEFHQWMGAGVYHHDLETGLLSVTAHGITRSLDNPLPGPYISVDRLAGGLRSTYDMNNLPFDLQVGGELKFQHDDRRQYNNEGGKPGDELTTDQTDRVNSQALFAKSMFHLDRLSLSAGLRADRMSFTSDDYLAGEEGTRIFTTVNPSIGVNYRFNNVTYYGNLSTSFESPTTTEFKNRPDSGNGFNPDLNPERAVGIETGLRSYFSNPEISIDLAIYGMRVSDQIVQESLTDGVAIFSNGGNANHFGLESHIRMRPFPSLLLELMYTWTHSVFAGGEFEFEEEYKGNQLPGVAPHRAGGVLTLDLGDHTFGSDLEWVSDYYADTENSARNDSYLLVNGRWNYRGARFENWSIEPFISVHNLLDTRYNTSVAINAFGDRFFEPGSSRSIQGGFSIQIR